jgi:branched-chain amino acid transport system substrate-binding protein
MKLGLLLPTSKMYPTLMIDFSAGVRMAISEFGMENEIELIFESIHQGTDKNLVLNSVNKLVLQHQTEVNILFSNFLLMEDIASSINALQRPTLLTNIGANIPNLFDSGDYILSNSFCLWESAHLAGKWGTKKFGKKSAHGSYFYEAGYNLYGSFCRGIAEENGEIIFNQISDFNPDPNDYQNFMKQMTVETPDFLYMLYSERDAVNFLNNLSKSPENGMYPIVTSGVLLNDEVLNKVEDTPKNIYNVTSWDVSDTSDNNKEFVSTYKNQTGNAPNHFALLGYECAAAILSAMQEEGWSKNGKDQVEAIKNNTFVSPRGKMEFDDTNATSFAHYVYHLDESKRRVKTDTIGTLQERKEIIELTKTDQNPAGWFQPYLCQ